MLKTAFVSLCLLMSVQGASTPRPLADVSVPTPDGKKIRLNQYRGKVMVIALISISCDHCANSMKLLDQFQKEYGPRGFQAFAIAGDENAEKMLSVVPIKQAYPLGYLDQNTTMQVFDFKRDDHPFVPIYLFVDKKGTVRFQYPGKDDFFKAEEKNTRILIEALLKQ
jgi:glutathione peroxidase-family protein